MIKKLLILNGLAILGVILFHASGWGFVAMIAWTHRYLPVTVPNYDQIGGSAYYLFRLIEQLIVVSIPAFLFVSGFFVAFATGRSQRTIGWHTIGSRIKNLLIPYLLWSFIILFLDFLQGQRNSVFTYLRLIFTGGATPAYYYVILLCQFYLISPFLVPLAKSRWVLLLIVTAVIQLGVQLLQYPMLLGLEVPYTLQPFIDKVPNWFFPARIFWFAFGIVAGFHLVKIKTFALQFKWILLALVIGTYLLGVFEWETYINISGHTGMTHRETLVDTLYSLAFLLTFIAFEKVSMPFSKQLGDLGSKSYGIYLVHVPVMSYAARAIYHITPGILGYQILFMVILIGLGLGIPLAMMAAINRTPARKYHQYIFG
jgi:peptidoglycan/LPS O-acetylase OafA/YrhL